MFDEEKLADWGLEKMKHYLIVVSGGSEKQLRAERPPTGENYFGSSPSQFNTNWRADTTKQNFATRDRQPWAWLAAMLPPCSSSPRAVSASTPG